MDKLPAEKGQPYRAYLMRLWPADGEAGYWRVRIKNVLASDEVHTFADLESLFYFLQSLSIGAEEKSEVHGSACHTSDQAE